MITKNITITAAIAAALATGHFVQRCSRNEKKKEDGERGSGSTYVSGGGGGGGAHVYPSSGGTSSKQSSVSRGGFGRSGWGFGGGS
jgi:hypothetical protein